MEPAAPRLSGLDKPLDKPASRRRLPARSSLQESRPDFALEQRLVRRTFPASPLLPRRAKSLDDLPCPPRSLVDRPAPQFPFHLGQGYGGELVWLDTDPRPGNGLPD